MVDVDPSGGTEVSLEGLRKSYGAFKAVHDVSVTIRPGEMVGLLGPSGCGKTTTLRMIAGLETPDAGSVRIGGRQVNPLPPWRRNIGMVFQSYALFPHMSVYDNVAFGLNMRRVGGAETRRQVDLAMAQVRLSDLAHRRPSELSGGQRQRVALARAIVTRPTVLLLDEPLAALDRKLREQMQVEIRQIQKEVGITTVFVTHDQEEALTLSDRIVVMEAGRIAQVGTPSEIYERPRSRFVSDFIGFTNALRGRLVSVEGNAAQVAMLSGQRFTVRDSYGLRADTDVDIVVRPEKVLLDGPPSADLVTLRGVVAHTVYTGSSTYVHVEVGDGQKIVAMVSNGMGCGAAPVGAAVTVTWRSDHTLLFAA